jgi:NAD(P)H dehydrogenase (quinone)
LVTQDGLTAQTVDLNGTPITQEQLAEYLNAAFGTDLTYRAMSSADFVADRTAELGDFIGPIIGGIYDGIRKGSYNRSGDFEAVTGRPHQTWADYFSSLAE